MQIITITSDWNEDDYYVAALKGKILTQCPQARIVDVSHKVRPFNTAQAAFLVRNSYRNFPKGTIHIIGINSEPGENGQLLAARIADQYFLCADNGILGLLGDPDPDMVVRIDWPVEDECTSFVALTVFGSIACRLASGETLEGIGLPVSDYNRRIPLRPTHEKNVITGSVIHVDSYQNAITNISREFFDRVGEGREFVIYVQSKHYQLKKINRWYSDSPEGEILALFNAVGLLEIAIRNGKASGLLNLNINSTIRVEFNEV
jgi:S-adenosylmethionine hydrolase